MAKFNVGDIIEQPNSIMSYLIVTIDHQLLYYSVINNTNIKAQTILFGDDCLYQLKIPGPFTASQQNTNKQKFYSGDIVTTHHDLSFSILVRTYDSVNKAYLIQYLAVPVGKEYLLTDVPNAYTFSKELFERDCIIKENKKPAIHPLKCECGQSKTYETYHRKSCPSHIHSSWCSMYKDTSK